MDNPEENQNICTYVVDAEGYKGGGAKSRESDLVYDLALLNLNTMRPLFYGWQIVLVNLMENHQSPLIRPPFLLLLPRLVTRRGGAVTCSSWRCGTWEYIKVNNFTGHFELVLQLRYYA